MDRYVHMKALTISGHYGRNRQAHVVYQGSANFSGMATLSDEQGFIVNSLTLEKAYSKFINYLFKNPPPQGQDLIKEIVLRQRRASTRTPRCARRWAWVPCSPP